MNIKVRQQSEFDRLDLGIDFAYTLLDNKETSGIFSLMHYTMGPFSKGPNLHIHDQFDQIFFVTKGSPTFIVDNIQKQINYGGIVVAPKGVPHNVINETDSEVSYLMILKPGGFENYFKDISQKLDTLTIEDISKLLTKYDERPI